MHGDSCAIFFFFCRSEHARDERNDTAGCRAPSVIVDDHREHARSYRGPASGPHHRPKGCPWSSATGQPVDTRILWERACPRWRCVIQHGYRLTHRYRRNAARSKPAPTRIPRLYVVLRRNHVRSYADLFVDAMRRYWASSVLRTQL
ncbi:Periplasmic sensory histidine protein kinase, two-component (plasmid) [Pseudomonas mandelii JR-1]|uniref:Periplasmic sensory histidine protein kinase, two-component n=1 Tax=Pseudomonas mandelii JR-1 TaxID=1147786 RepID=A0A024EM60_9PSED|nr:Periplasmic sensory histidine protein kinase, two-component [Pseudomonas mandelii JR-1]